MSKTSESRTYKIVTLGSSGVGKTSLMFRLIENIFNETQSSTIGASFMAKKLTLMVKPELGSHPNDQIEDPLSENPPKPFHITIELFDTAGQERYESLAPLYYRAAHAALIIYDVTDPDTWERAKKWVQTLKENRNNEILIVLIGNKIDLGRRVGSDELERYAKEEGLIYYELSAKCPQVDSATYHATNMIFDEICHEIINKENKLKLEKQEKLDKGDSNRRDNIISELRRSKEQNKESSWFRKLISC